MRRRVGASVILMVTVAVLVASRIVGHALARLIPDHVYDTPRHGGGVRAPSLRFHAGRFWIYYPDPDYGIFVVSAKNPAGPWSAPTLVKGGKGLIDPCPLWDEDGSVYLVHAWAKSRAACTSRILERTAASCICSRWRGDRTDGR